MVLLMWLCALEKYKYAGLAQDIGFGPAFFHSLISLVRQCEADLTDAPCLWLVNPNDWPMWFAISSLSPICSPNFSFMDGIRKKKKKLNFVYVRIIFAGSHTEHSWGCSNEIANQSNPMLTKIHMWINFTLAN